jgi:hypothetical protein
MNAPLIVVAEAIDTARIAANQNDSTAPQGGVYGDLTDALIKTLVLITGSMIEAGHVYDRILDGATVTEALKQ